MPLEKLTPRQAFGRRLRAAVESHEGIRNLDQLSDRLAGIGVKVSRPTLQRFQAGTHAPNIDEALAICWALGVAPVYMLAPFEDTTGVQSGPYVSYDAPAFLHVADEVDMHPVEARSWIAGISLRSVDPDWGAAWQRFGYDETPPPVKAALKQRALELGRQVLRVERTIARKRRGTSGEYDEYKHYERHLDPAEYARMTGVPAPIAGIVGRLVGEARRKEGETNGIATS